MTPEFSRRVALDRADSADVVIEADAAECAAIAARLDVPTLAALRCRFRLQPDRDGALIAQGHLQAGMTQHCIVTLEPFDVALDERFRVRLVPEDRLSTDLDPEGDDEIPYSGTMVDLGEVAVEQLALLIDPYPRRPGAELPESATDHSANPFAALASRRTLQ